MTWCDKFPDLTRFEFFQALPPALRELEQLKEFWDPDTVDLMEWIKKDTAPNASFTGSMQLLAGVKLCTDRPITNHPHYEDKKLRLKTKEVSTIFSIICKSRLNHLKSSLKNLIIQYMYMYIFSHFKNTE